LSIKGGTAPINTATNIARHFTAAGGVANVYRVVQIQRFDKLRQVVGIGVHVVARPWLAGSAVAATVMGHAAVAAGGQKEHLVLKRIRAQRPTMTEDHRLPTTPVLIIYVDIAGVFLTDSDVWHGNVSLELR
jgi:hypothetical protein